jgi:hypothetical protein
MEYDDRLPTVHRNRFRWKDVRGTGALLDS